MTQIVCVICGCFHGDPETSDVIFLASSLWLFTTITFTESILWCHKVK